MSTRATQTASTARRHVELRSDTFTLPTPEMRRAMSIAEVGDDVHGEDPTVRQLEALAARTLGKEAACFMPSGTMANLASILTHCPRGSKVIVGADSDIYVYEAGGASICGGVTYHPIRNAADGTLALDEIEAAFPPDPKDPQFAVPKLVCLENPQNHSGGKVLPMSYLADVAALAEARRIAVHMDGARIFNAAIASGTSADQIARHADSVQFCLSKGLGAPVGSVLVGTETFVARARRVRKMLGGGMRQAGVLAAAGIVALEDRARLAEDHESAQRLANGLDLVPGITVERAATQMNMVFFRVTDPCWDVPRFIAAAAERGVVIGELGPGRLRCVTHRGVDQGDVDHALSVFRWILGRPIRKPEQES